MTYIIISGEKVQASFHIVFHVWNLRLLFRLVVVAHSGVSLHRNWKSCVRIFDNFRVLTMTVSVGTVDTTVRQITLPTFRKVPTKAYKDVIAIVRIQSFQVVVEVLQELYGQLC